NARNMGLKAAVLVVDEQALRGRLFQIGMNLDLGAGRSQQEHANAGDALAVLVHDDFFDDQPRLPAELKILVGDDLGGSWRRPLVDELTFQVTPLLGKSGRA